jgi:hypothetical protein
MKKIRREFAMEMLLALIKIGKARFEPNTGEFCFDGLRYYSGKEKESSVIGFDPMHLVQVIGEDKIAKALGISFAL